MRCLLLAYWSTQYEYTRQAKATSSENPNTKASQAWFPPEDLIKDFKITKQPLLSRPTLAVCLNV